MDFTFSDDQRLFADAVHDVMTHECPPGAVREACSSDDGTIAGLWQTLSTMGVIGMTAPVRSGGLGSSELDLVLLMEELGRAACPEIVLEHTALALPILAGSDGPVSDRWLATAATGDVRVTVGLDSPYVLGADQVDLLLLEHDGVVHAVEPTEVTLTRQRSIDETRRLYEIGWDPATAQVVSRDPQLVHVSGQRAAVAAAAQCVGVAQQLLDLTVAYVVEREQFGKPVGVNQAVKHHLANTGKAIEFARPLVYRAAWTLATEAPDVDAAVPMAKLAASRAADLACRTSLQCHGAIAYTVEYDLQLWLKRGWALAAAWGDATACRNAVGATLGI